MRPAPRMSKRFHSFRTTLKTWSLLYVSLTFPWILNSGLSRVLPKCRPWTIKPFQNSSAWFRDFREWKLSTPPKCLLYQNCSLLKSLASRSTRTSYSSHVQIVFHLVNCFSPHVSMFLNSFWLCSSFENLRLVLILIICLLKQCLLTVRFQGFCTAIRPIPLNWAEKNQYWMEIFLIWLNIM